MHKLGFRDNLGYRSGSRLFVTLIEVAGDQAAMSNMVAWFNFLKVYTSAIKGSWVNQLPLIIPFYGQVEEQFVPKLSRITLIIQISMNLHH